MLAKWATSGETSLKEALGPSRARWFKAQYEKMNADPQQILQAMLTQKPTGQQTFISIEALQKKSLDFKSKVKPAPPKPKPAAVKPKPAPKAAAAPNAKTSAGIADRVLQPGPKNELVFKKQGGTAKMFEDSFTQLEAVKGDVGAHARKMRQFMEKQDIVLHPSIPEKFANGERFKGNQALIKAQRHAVEALEKQGNDPGALNGARSLLKALEEGNFSELKTCDGQGQWRGWIHNAKLWNRQCGNVAKLHDIQGATDQENDCRRGGLTQASERLYRLLQGLQARHCCA